MTELSARERIILAIDTSSEEEAVSLMQIAFRSGARFVKLGLELSTATSWNYCSDLARSFGLDWVADAKLHDIGNTTVKAARNISRKAHPPFGITIHAGAGSETMRNTQMEVGDIKILGITVLTSIKSEPEVGKNLSEAERMFHVPVTTKVMEFAIDAARAGLLGIVSSPQEVGLIKSDPETQGLFAMIPATRSAGAGTQDQARVGTPAAAIRDGADLLVIGRQITEAENPAQAYAKLVAEIQSAL